MNAKKFLIPYVLLITSLILAACVAPTAAPQPAAEQLVAATQEPAAEPTPVPSEQEVVIHYLTVQQKNEGWPLIIGMLTSEYQADHPNVQWEYENVPQTDLVQRIQLLDQTNSACVPFMRCRKVSIGRIM